MLDEKCATDMVMNRALCRSQLTREKEVRGSYTSQLFRVAILRGKYWKVKIKVSARFKKELIFSIIVKESNLSNNSRKHVIVTCYHTCLPVYPPSLARVPVSLVQSLMSLESKPANYPPQH